MQKALIFVRLLLSIPYSTCSKQEWHVENVEQCWVISCHLGHFVPARRMLRPSKHRLAAQCWGYVCTMAVAWCSRKESSMMRLCSTLIYILCCYISWKRLWMALEQRNYIRWITVAFCGMYNVIDLFFYVFCYRGSESNMSWCRIKTRQQGEQGVETCSVGQIRLSWHRRRSSSSSRWVGAEPQLQMAQVTAFKMLIGDPKLHQHRPQIEKVSETLFCAVRIGCGNSGTSGS